MTNDRWEYHVRQTDNPLSEEELNHLGAQGWELATAILIGGGHYIFKRTLPDLPERITLEQRDAVARHQAETGTS